MFTVERGENQIFNNTWLELCSSLLIVLIQTRTIFLETSFQIYKSHKNVHSLRLNTETYPEKQAKRRSYMLEMCMTILLITAPDQKQSNYWKVGE